MLGGVECFDAVGRNVTQVANDLRENRGFRVFLPRNPSPPSPRVPGPPRHFRSFVSTAAPRAGHARGLCVGRFGSRLVTLGRVWSRLVTFGHVGSRLVTLGRVWSRLVTLGRVVSRWVTFWVALGGVSPPPVPPPGPRHLRPPPPPPPPLRARGCPGPSWVCRACRARTTSGTAPSHPPRQAPCHAAIGRRSGSVLGYPGSVLGLI